MKIIGPIIRILGEKIYPEIKEKLMDITKLLITKSKDDIKGISPQLQSVFIKTLTVAILLHDIFSLPLPSQFDTNRITKECRKSAGATSHDGCRGMALKY